MAGHTSDQPATLPERSGGIHFPCLDAYRAIGMLMVLANHSAFATGWIQGAGDPGAGAFQRLAAPVVARFDLAVPMFFVLSGFLLYRPLAAAAISGRRTTPARTFYRRRALRIVPGYWAALAGLAVFSVLSSTFDLGLHTVGDWISNILVLPAFGLPGNYGITQAWSIGVEVAFYLGLPLWVGLLHRMVTAVSRRVAEPSPVVSLLVGCAVLYGTGQLFRAVAVLADPGWVGRTLLWLPMYLDLFAVGMALAVVSVAGGTGATLPAAARWCGRHPVWCWVMASAGLVLVAQMEPPSVPFGLNGTEYLPRQLAYGFISALWLAPSMFGPQHAGRLRRFLASPPLVWLGGISLSFYLWHLAFVEQAKAWTVAGYDDLSGLAVFTGSFPVIFVVAGICTVVVAAAVHRFVEMPFLRRKGQPAS
jgi:peptidoglycan/LPS O-acetylase OafA/YrhL